MSSRYNQASEFCNANGTYSCLIGVQDGKEFASSCVEGNIDLATWNGRCTYANSNNKTGDEYRCPFHYLKQIPDFIFKEIGNRSKRNGNHLYRKAVNLTKAVTKNTVTAQVANNRKLLRGF